MYDNMLAYINFKAQESIFSRQVKSKYPLMTLTLITLYNIICEEKTYRQKQTAS